MATAIVASLLVNKDGQTGDTEDEAITVTEEARLLIEALQNDEISDEQLLKLANTKVDKYAPETSAEFERFARVKKLVSFLDVNADGLVSPEELKQIRGRLYKRLQEGEDPAKPPKEFYSNAAAVGQFDKVAKTFLKHREGYCLCFVHFIFFGIVMAILALQHLTTLEYDSRYAISRIVFPSSVFGQDLTMVNDVILDSKVQHLHLAKCL